ncbi:hypothetical protein M8818_005749 [Zalaria obscura]|uniref:Uncharacterized protein n=1 Tax=Zalaria obscura TaxID=2024903 RepID=A0ACC3S9F0_9PEZI
MIDSGRSHDSYSQAVAESWPNSSVQRGPSLPKLDLSPIDLLALSSAFPQGCCRTDHRCRYGPSHILWIGTYSLVLVDRCLSVSVTPRVPGEMDGVGWARQAEA